MLHIPAEELQNRLEEQRDDVGAENENPTESITQGNSNRDENEDGSSVSYNDTSFIRIDTSTDLPPSFSDVQPWATTMTSKVPPLLSSMMAWEGLNSMQENLAISTLDGSHVNTPLTTDDQLTPMMRNDL